MLECVANVSEGRDAARLDALAAAAEAGGAALLDVHADPEHHRSVFTLVGPAVPAGARSLARRAVELLDLRFHRGAHPRLGVLDVMPFIELDPTRDQQEARRARDDFAIWAGAELGLPCFLYGPGRSLPEVRRGAFSILAPDTGPPAPHPTAGAVAVGLRPPMVAYNLWLRDQDLAMARALAGRLRGAAVRALGFDLDGRAQLSFNLIEPSRVGPADIYDRAVAAGARVDRAELVGLVPSAVLEAIPERRWTELGLSRAVTIEERLGARRQEP